MGEAVPTRSLARRLRARGLATASWIACRLPEPPLLALADLAGRLWYRLAPERRRRARRNLTRVTRWLADHDLGTPEARAAARDGRALNGLVSASTMADIKAYLRWHVIRVSADLLPKPFADASFDFAYLDRWLVWENPDVIDTALTEVAGSLFVGLHMGWYELPALVAAMRTGRLAIVPSETIGDPELQAYLVASRRRLGLELIDLASAKRRLTDALRRGQTVGLLGDRDITGGGIEVDFFGAPAPLAAGPALLALETGVAPYVFGVWRDATGVYHVRIEQVPLPAEGTRRERVTAYLNAEARAFERFVAAAPEQWLAVFHPLWPDLEAAA